MLKLADTRKCTSRFFINLYFILLQVLWLRSLVIVRGDPTTFVHGPCFQAILRSGYSWCGRLHAQPQLESALSILWWKCNLSLWSSRGTQHEMELLGGKVGFVAYERRYWYPSVESRSNSPFYYSYETGPLHIVMLGCYVDYLQDSEQAEWLKQDLASVDRQRTPWLIVGMHVRFLSGLYDQSPVQAIHLPSNALEIRIKVSLAVHSTRCTMSCNGGIVINVSLAAVT